MKASSIRLSISQGLIACAAWASAFSPAVCVASVPTDLRPALDGDHATLFYFLGALPNASQDVASDSLVVTATDPRHPDAPKRWTVRTTLRLSGVNQGSTLFPAPYSQLLWVTQGKVYRMRLDAGLGAPATRVSALSEVCELVSSDPAKREDAWVLAIMADRRGHCPQGGDVAGVRLIRADAGPADPGVPLGHLPDVRVLGTLRRSAGGEGPLLVHRQRTGRLEVVDPMQVDPSRPEAVGTQTLMVVSDKLPVQFEVTAGVSTQVGVLQANGLTQLLDWRDGAPRLLPVNLPKQAAPTPWMVTGPWGGHYLMSQGTDVVSVDLQGQARLLAQLPVPTEGEDAGKALGMQIHLHGCALAVQTASVPGTQTLPKALNQVILNPQWRSVMPLSMANEPQLNLRPQDSLVMWRPKPDMSGLQVMTRIDCNSGRNEILVPSALEMAGFPWFGPQGRQRIRPLLVPSQADAFDSILVPQGRQRVLTGSKLKTYNEDRGTWLDHGALPQIGGLHITDLVPSSQQVSTRVWLFEALLTDAQGRKWLTALMVNANQDGPVQVMFKPLPWPAP